MIDSKTFFEQIYGESDGSYVQSGFGAKRQTKSSGTTKTPVDTSPSTKIDAKTIDGKGVGRSYDKSNDPVRSRPGSVEFPRPQSISPTNPQAQRPSGLRDMWVKADLEQSTREAQRRQSQNYTNRKS